MKKQMKWLLAALALAALATPAFAVTADMTGTLAIRGIANNNVNGGASSVKDKQMFADQRFRLFTSVAANENVKAVLGLEVDNGWGRSANTGAATTINVAAPGTGTVTIPGAAVGGEVGAMAADAKGQLEIKHLYLDFKIPALGANVKAGTQAFNFGRGIVMGDDAAGLAISLPCPVLPDNKLDLTWIKITEGPATAGVNATGDDDADFYGAKYTLKAGGIAIAPYVGYYKAGGTTPALDTHAAFFGADVDGKAGPVGYALTAIYNNWSKGVTEGSSIALYGKGTMDLGATSLSLEAARYGDDDNGGSSMSLKQGANTGPVVNFSEIVTGGMYTTNSIYRANINGADALYTTNYLYAKVGAVQKLSDTMKASVYLMHIAQAEDTAATAAGKAKTYGQEVDAYFDYTIVPGLGLNVLAAYLLTDDDFGDDNIYKVGTSLNYKF